MKITTICPTTELKKLRNIALNPNTSLRYAFMRGKQLQANEIDQFSDTILTFTNQSSRLQYYNFSNYNSIGEFLWFSIGYQKDNCAGVRNKEELHKLFDEYLIPHYYFISVKDNVDEEIGNMLPLEEVTQIKSVFYHDCKALRELSFILNGEKSQAEESRYLGKGHSKNIYKRSYNFNFEKIGHNVYIPSAKLFMKRRKQLEEMIGLLGKHFYNCSLKEQADILNQFAEQLCFANTQEYLIDGINKLKNIYGVYFGQLALHERSFLYSLLTKDSFQTVLSEQGQIGFFPQFVLSLITMEFSMLFQLLEKEKMIDQISKERSRTSYLPDPVLEYRLSQLKEACAIGDVSYQSFSDDFQQSKVTFKRINSEDYVTMTIEEVLFYLDTLEKILERKQQKEKIMKK